jgi:hypothetical protein
MQVGNRQQNLGFGQLYRFPTLPETHDLAKSSIKKIHNVNLTKLERDSAMLERGCSIMLGTEEDAIDVKNYNNKMARHLKALKKGSSNGGYDENSRESSLAQKLLENMYDSLSKKAKVLLLFK